MTLYDDFRKYIADQNRKHHSDRDSFYVESMNKVLSEARFYSGLFKIDPEDALMIILTETADDVQNRHYRIRKAIISEIVSFSGIPKEEINALYSDVVYNTHDSCLGDCFLALTEENDFYELSERSELQLACNGREQIRRDIFVKDFAYQILSRMDPLEICILCLMYGVCTEQSYSLDELSELLDIAKTDTIRMKYVMMRKIRRLSHPLLIGEPVPDYMCSEKELRTMVASFLRSPRSHMEEITAYIGSIGSDENAV